MATLLAITGTPSLYAQGTWPRDAMHDAPWEFDLVGTASTNGDTKVIASNGNNCGLWYIGGELQLYDSDNDLLLSEPVSWSSSSVVTVRVDHPAREVSVSGADSGDGVYGYSTSNVLWRDEQLDVGASPGEPGGAFQLIDFAAVSDFRTLDDDDDEIDLPLAAGTGTAHAVTAESAQPASLPLASAIGTAHAPTVGASVDLAHVVATGDAHALSAGAPVSLPTAVGLADVHAFTAGAVSPVELPAASASAAAPAVSASSVSPVSLPAAVAAAAAHGVELAQTIALAVASARAWALAFAGGGRSILGTAVRGVRMRGRR